MNKNLSLRQILFVFITVMSFIVVMATLAYDRLVNLVESSEAINKNTDFVLKLEEVISYLKDAETGSRGYLLTSDTTFLRPQKHAGVSVMTLLLELRQDAQKTDEQIPYIDSILRMAKNKIDITWSLVNSIKVNEIKPLTTTQKEMIVKGKATMDTIRQTVQNLKVLEQERLKINKGVQGDFAKSSPRFLLIIITTAISILIITMWGIYKQFLLLNKTQKTLENKIDELAKANVELDQYAFALTHHLQEPLRKIGLFSSKFESKLKKTPNTEGGGDIEAIQKISKLAADCQYLLDEFLAFANLSQDNKESREVVDLSELIKSIWEERKDFIINIGAEYVTEGNSEINGHKKQLYILFEQLIDNALKFRHFERTPRINFKFQEEIVDSRPYFTITMSDNGIGFEEEYSEKVFMLFQKLNHNLGGLGVGLAISRKIVEFHEGIISIESKIGEGTVLHIKIPLK